MSDDQQLKVVLNDRANLSSDRHKLLRIGAKQVSYSYAKATGTITRGTILFDAVDLPDLGNSVISRNMRVRYQVKITAGAGQLGMFNPNVSMDTGVGELHLPYGALRPFPLSTCTNACTVSINGSSNTVRLRDVMSAVTRTIPQEYLEKEATEGPSQLDNAWVLVSDNTIGTGAYMATSAQPLSSCYNCPNGTSRASFAPLSYVESGPLGDEAIFEVTEPILCSPMTLSAEETWLANVNVLNVLYVYSDLGDMCVYGAVTTDAGSVLPVYPPNYKVELVEGSARLIFGIATVDNEVIVVPPVVNYPFSKPDLHTTHLKPWVAPMSTGEVQNTGTVVSETIRLTYTPSLIYIYAQLPVNIRAQNAVATEYPYADVFYSLGSASGTTLAGLTYDTSQNILSIRWNRREGFLAGATIKDLYRVSVSNGYQSSFNDWLASPIIIINPVKDMGIDFSNDTYADMAGHNSLTVSCSFNTYNLLTRTAQVLGSQAPAEIGEFYSYLNTYVGAPPADANLLKMVNNVLQPLASFQMRDALGRLRPENTYVFYDPVDNVFFACGHTRKSLFLYAGLGATLGTLLDELVIDAIVSATYFEGRVTICHARVAPFTDATEVSFYRSINNQLVQVEGATLTHDAQGNPFTNITSASQDADNVVIANVLDISVFSRTGPQTYWYPIDPDAVPPAGMLRAPARKMLGAGAGVTGGYEYYAFTDGLAYVYLYSGLINLVNPNPTQILKFQPLDSFGEGVNLISIWYNPFTSLFVTVGTDVVYIYNDTGAYVNFLNINICVASNFCCSAEADSSFLAVATSTSATIYKVVGSTLTQQGPPITEGESGALANIVNIAITGNNIAIVSDNGLTLSTYNYTGGIYFVRTFPTTGSTVNAVAVDNDDTMYTAVTNNGPYIILMTGELYENLATTEYIINSAMYYSMACFADYVYLVNSYPDRPVFYQGNISTVTTSTEFIQFGSSQQANYALSAITHHIQGGTELMLGLGQNLTTNNFALMCNSSPTIARFNTVSPDFYAPNTEFPQISVDALGYVWLCCAGEVFKINELPEVLPSAPYLNWSAVTFSGPTFSLSETPVTSISSVTFDNTGGLWVLYNSAIYSTQLIGGTYEMTFYLTVQEQGGGDQQIYIPPSVATTGKTGVTTQVINKNSITLETLIASVTLTTGPNAIMYDQSAGQLRDYFEANTSVGLLDSTTLIQQSNIPFTDQPQGTIGYTTSGPAPTYTITYDLAGGLPPAPIQAPQVAGATFNLALAPTRAGYTFVGWLDSFSSTVLVAGYLYTMPAEDVTFTAQWAVEYTVTYLLAGAPPPAPITPNQPSGAEFTLPPAPPYTGYSFQGWLDSFYHQIWSSTGQQYTMVAENVTFTATWLPLYTVTYSLNGGIGTIPTQAPQIQDALFNLAGAPTVQAGYTFSTWYDGVTQYNAGAQYQMPPNDVTITAQWSYSITFNLAGGTPQAPAQSALIGANVPLPDTPTNASFVFQGWQLGKQLFPANYNYIMIAQPITFTAVWNPPPPSPPSPPATFNQYYSFIGADTNTIGYLYSSINSPALTQPTLQYSFNVADPPEGGTVVPYNFFYDALKSVYFVVTAQAVFLYDATGTYITKNAFPSGTYSGASFFPTTDLVNGTLIVYVGSTTQTVYVYEQVGSTNFISLTATITTNFAGQPLTGIAGAVCDRNCLVIAVETASTFTVYDRSELNVYTALRDVPINGSPTIASISVDEPFNTLYVASQVPNMSTYSITTYDLTNGALYLTEQSGIFNYFIFDQPTSQLRAINGGGGESLSFFDITTLQSQLTGAFGHYANTFGYATSPAVPPPPPPLIPKYQYFSFINTSQAYLYKIEVGVDIQPVLALSFEALDQSGQPIIGRFLFYDALNERFWAVGVNDIYVYHRNTLLMAHQQFPVGSIISASFYPATGVGHSPQVVIPSISGGSQTVQIWKTVGSQLILAMPSITVNNGSSLQCAGRDASTLVIASNTPSIIEVYNIATMTLTNTFNPPPTMISLSVDTVGELFYTTDTNNHVQSYNLVTGVMVEDRAGITSTLGNITYDTLSEGLVVGAFDLGAISLSPKTLITLASYTMNSLGLIGYSTSNTAPPTQESTITYDLNGASGSFPPATWPDGQSFVVQGYGTPPAGFNFLYWFFGTSTIGIGGYTWWPMPTGGGALVAQWTYDITYALAGGTSPTPTQAPVSANTSFTVAPTPTRLNYTFVGWTDGTTLYGAGSTYTMPVAPTAQPVTLTATWIASNTYTVTYSLISIEGGGPAGPPPTQAPQEAGAIFNLATITPPTGYTFGRWTDSYYGLAYDAGEPYTMPADDVTITAIEWTISVTYVLNGGIGPAPTQVPVQLGGDFVVGPAVSRVGYSFAGWNDGTTTYQPSATYTVGIDQTPITLTAQWTQVLNSYSVASLSVDSVNNQFYCVIDEYSGAGAFMSSKVQRRQITNGDLSATVTDGALVYNIIYDYTSNQLVTASSLRPYNVNKLNVDTLAENTAYIVPCAYLGFTTSVPVPIVQDWATLPNLDFQIVCVEEGICQISPDFFRINTACMSMAEVKEAIETASQDGSFIPQSLDDSPRTLFGGQRAVISGTARGYDGDDDEESINSE